METYNGVACVAPLNAAAWREWLTQHHKTEKSVWLVLYHKGKADHNLTYSDAVDEALCFGWIDSKPNKRDAISSYLYMSVRNPKSNWSGVNKQKIERLMAEQRMADAGLAMVALAKTTGTWQALDAVDALQLPAPMEALLNDNTTAAQYWAAFPKSAKRGILEWIYNAKTEPTRLKRIEETVALAEKNERANQFKRP
jgi:uncharacterized protein YdeI (YjbR/CyaY-like superfamily)